STSTSALPEIDAGAAVRASAISSTRLGIRYCSTGAMRGYLPLASRACALHAAHGTTTSATAPKLIILTLVRRMRVPSRRPGVTGTWRPHVLLESDGRGAAISTGGPEGKSAPPFQQECSHGGVLREPDGPVEGVPGITRSSQTLEEMRANGPVRLAGRDAVANDRIERSKPSHRAGRLGHRGGVPGARSQRRRQRDEMFVEQHDRGPVGLAVTHALAAYGLYRGLELEAAGATVCRRSREIALRFLDRA